LRLMLHSRGGEAAQIEAGDADVAEAYELQESELTLSDKPDIAFSQKGRIASMAASCLMNSGDLVLVFLVAPCLQVCRG
jgi:hypothetical protein